MKLAVKEQIEELRLRMHEIASNKVLTDPRVVRASEKVDILINEFYFVSKKGKGYNEDIERRA